ncbi:MMPL family transporter [Streptomyces sp. NBC_00083]|uniref:MMPL family transporter n=1 Tax=Streptomyces sp. NBC_00083 TaxID=2975647 RepID=UPI002252DF3E|nr:MMPL family transporter [Streptomyces sp. NBC_00083]MCX5387424.1 MMPL family transporter [Streptomyces sp. NBC_00083]
MRALRERRWLLPGLLLVVWLVIGGGLGPFAGKLGQVASNDGASFLPQSAESTQVLSLQREMDAREALPLVIVWSAAPAPLPAGTMGAARKALGQMAGSPALAGAPSPVVTSDDRQALQAVLPLRADLGTDLRGAVDSLRSAAHVAGVTVFLAGPAASQADLGDAFSGIDGLLLGVALGVVLVILLAVYRSVLLPFLVILSAVFALGLASGIVYALAQHGVVRIDGQVQGILSILVIGAATDYALLLSARFREELTHTPNRFDAMRTAWRRSVEPVAASATTVALGLLALLLSDLANNQALGPVGAIGVACAALAALTFLPAVLVLLGPGAYWPARPRSGQSASSGLWERVSRLIARSPRKVWGWSLAALLAASCALPLFSARGLPLEETFIHSEPSVTAQRVLDSHFPAGQGDPAVVLTDVAQADRVLAVVRATPGVANVSRTPHTTPDRRTALNAVLAAPSDSRAAQQTIVRLREAVHRVPGAHALVGGRTAQQLDTQDTAARDRLIIIPVVLAIITLILVLLLRALTAPLLLIATVILNFTATLGVSALVFPHLFGLDGADASVPLYGFVFLVALGVDYNIFLMTRVREESRTHGTRAGVLRGLSTTGGVITSAGVVLAATFSALGVIPLAFLLQIAFIVAFGVLLDTVVVRSLLVPGLVYDLGSRVWWPSRLSRAQPRPPAAPERDRTREQ